MKYTSCFINEQPDGSKQVKLGKKTMGAIIGTRFEKRVRGSTHMLRKVPGWAIDVDVLELLDEEGVEVIVIEDVETGTIYEATLIDIRDNGLPVNFHKYGRQICLPLSFWKTTIRV